MKPGLIALVVLAVLAGAAALGYEQLRNRENEALTALLERAEAMSAGSDCLKADAALPLLERIATQVEASRFQDSGALVQASQRLLAPAIKCQIWIRAQNLTFDEREISTAAITARVNAALAFEQARADYVAAGNGGDPAQQARRLESLYAASFGAPMPEPLRRHVDALARGFALSGDAMLAVPGDYRNKLTQNIATSATRFAEYRKRRAMTCMSGLADLQAQLRNLHEHYDYPPSILHTLDPLAQGASNCPTSAASRG